MRQIRFPRARPFELRQMFSEHKHECAKQPKMA